MKDRTIALAIMIFLGSVVIYQFEANKGKQAEIDDLRTSLNSYATGYQNLIISKDDIEIELQKKDSNYAALKKLLDKERAKPKQIQSARIENVEIRTREPTPIVNEDTLKARKERGDSIYKTEFNRSLDCVKLSGYILSSDKNPTVVIDTQDVSVRTMEVVIKRKWYQFWKPRIRTIIVPECGDLKITNIQKRK